MKLSDRQLLAGVGLLALAIVVTVATLLVAAIGRGGSPSEPGAEAIRVNADLSPHTQLFGDMVTARIAIAIDADRIALDSLRVDGRFGRVPEDRHTDRAPVSGRWHRIRRLDCKAELPRCDMPAW